MSAPRRFLAHSGELWSLTERQRTEYLRAVQRGVDTYDALREVGAKSVGLVETVTDLDPVDAEWRLKSASEIRRLAIPKAKGD